MKKGRTRGREEWLRALRAAYSWGHGTVGTCALSHGHGTPQGMWPEDGKADSMDSEQKRSSKHPSLSLHCQRSRTWRLTVGIPQRHSQARALDISLPPQTPVLTPPALCPPLFSLWPSTNCVPGLVLSALYPLDWLVLLIPSLMTCYTN